MKKYFTVLLVLGLCGLTACGGNNSGEIKDVTSEDMSQETTAFQIEKTEVENDDIYSWNDNIVTYCACNNNNEFQNYHIAFPADTGADSSYGKMSRANDGTAAFVGSQVYDSDIECSSVEDVFTAFESQILKNADDLLDESTSKDLSFTVSSQQSTEVSGLAACKYEGTFKFTTNKGTFSRYFAAYSVQHSNGAYSYWVVFDESEDQSLNKVAASDADIMATYFGED